MGRPRGRPLDQGPQRHRRPPHDHGPDGLPVRAISVGNSSEFMTDIEADCTERVISLYLLSRSPKLHARVERANRTHTEEFHEVTDIKPDLAHLAPPLRE